MPSIYLASRYSNRDLLRQYRQQLVEYGFKVTSSWLDTDWQLQEQGSSAAPPEYQANWAQQDFNDVARADIVVSFTCHGRGRGGRHVEFGIGLALGKTMILIGHPEHLFHEHPTVKKYEGWDEFLVDLLGGKLNA